MAHFAGRAGLEDGACDSLVSALEDFCQEALLLLDAPVDTLEVEIVDLADRLEIVVEQRTLARVSNTGGAEVQNANGSATGAFATSRLLLAVDQVEHIAENGSMRTRLVKYISSRNGNS